MPEPTSSCSSQACSEPASTRSTELAGDAIRILDPLTEWYQANAWPMPTARQIHPREIQPFARQLLCHDDDMTPTLESFHGESLALVRLSQRIEDQVLHRLVVLEGESTSKRYLYGAIRIHLGRLDDSLHESVVTSRTPLGRILIDQSIPHTSHPSLYLACWSDDAIADALDIDKEKLVFGRQNTLSDSQGQWIAQVLELLPPIDGANNSQTNELNGLPRGEA